MPSHIMDQRHPSSLFIPPAPSSFFSEEICVPSALPSERQPDFQNIETDPQRSGSDGLPSLPETTSLLLNDAHFGKSIHATNSACMEERAIEVLEKIEAQTIGDLLPDDDDLLSGVIDEVESTVQNNSIDEDDLFYSGGGMEMEGMKTYASGELLSRKHHSRTLTMRNVNSNIEDAELKKLFEIFHDPNNQNKKAVEFYDVRAAEAALRGLSMSEIAGKRIRIEPGFCGSGWQCLGKDSSPEVEHEGSSLCRNGSSLHCSSLESGVSSGSVTYGASPTLVLDNESINTCLQTLINPLMESRKGFSPVNGHQYLLNNSTTSLPISGSLMWQNSPSFVNNIPGTTPLHMDFQEDHLALCLHVFLRLIIIILVLHLLQILHYGEGHYIRWGLY
ncbi:hypothetical protein HPP92_000331 [Vanilla planifolia]|uniref:Uncharacterized protein n=1 Tax=Vanilla planifolia TaxID=51239 RepID=A0A835VG01_VANPL|nr:hypothetical protein HPP92_000331 [Vanilla planifolia]